MIMQSETLRDAIIQTLAYFDIFDYPLTETELSSYLIGFSAAENEVQKCADVLENVESYGGYYFLKGRREILAIRERRELLAQERWKKVMRYVPLLRHIPGVKMIAVCNTLALNQADPDSDIDLFIVTAKNRLFTARAIITGLFSLLNIRRTHSKIAGRFCLSFFATEESLNLSEIALRPYDIYLAFWARTLKPVFGKETYQRFLYGNRWMANYFQNWHGPNISPPATEVPTSTFLESILAKYQKERARRKAKLLGPESSIIIGDAILKFHNVDRRATFRDQWEQNRAKLRCR